MLSIHLWATKKIPSKWRLFATQSVLVSCTSLKRRTKSTRSLPWQKPVSGLSEARVSVLDFLPLQFDNSPTRQLSRLLPPRHPQTRSRPAYLRQQGKTTRQSPWQHGEANLGTEMPDKNESIHMDVCGRCRRATSEIFLGRAQKG